MLGVAMLGGDRGLSNWVKLRLEVVAVLGGLNCTSEDLAVVEFNIE